MIVNIENATNGAGISFKNYKELKELGIDVMTSGNHIFDKQETLDFIKKEKEILRPFNSNPYYPGKGTVVIEKKNKKIRITNLIGTDFINTPGSNPYFALEIILKKDKKNKSDIHFVDFHAESTGEKQALAKYFDGKITGFWGTHTHVQTADEYITEKGTAYITDIGMTGPSEGVIGVKPEVIWKRKKEGLWQKITPCPGKGQLNGIIIETNDDDDKPMSINRIFIRE